MREHDKINIKLGVYRGDQKMVKYVEVAQTIMDEVKKACLLYTSRSDFMHAEHLEKTKIG